MRNLTLNQFCLWLEDTPISQYIQVSDWIVPCTQIIHIFAVSAALSVALMISLRLLGLFATEKTFSTIFDRCWSVFLTALIILLISGSILIVGEPSRSLANETFQLKMLLLVAVLGTLRIIKVRLANPKIDWKSGYTPDVGVESLGKALSLILLLLLTGVVFAGRWIAYT